MNKKKEGQIQHLKTNDVLLGIYPLQELSYAAPVIIVYLDEFKTGQVAVREAFLVAPDYLCFQGKHAVDKVQINPQEAAL